MKQYNTIHIFGYGESQVIGKDVNFKAKTSDLTAAQPLIDAVIALAPEGVTITPNTYHAINFFYGSRTDYQSQITGQSFSVNTELIDPELINNLVVQLEEQKIAAEAAAAQENENPEQQNG
jgi:hypothetical protein